MPEKKQWYHSLRSSLKTQDMPARLCRGAPVSVLLGLFSSTVGGLIRQTPDALTEEVRFGLYNLSVMVPYRLAAFISHSWRSGGTLKYLTLLVHFMGTPMVISMIIISTGIYLFQQFVYELPSVAFQTNKLFEYSHQVSPWEYFGGLLGGYCAFFLGHTFKAGTCVFFDSVCIDQKSPAEGIAHLPEFLKISDELLILWDELYFSRLWCVAEMALFKGLQPNGRVRLLPMNIMYAIIGMHLFYAFNIGSYFFMIDKLPQTVIGTHMAFFLSVFLLFAAAAYLGANYKAHQLSLIQQLETFDIQSANVKVAADRDRIYDMIISFFGTIEKFNELVRTSMKKSIEEDIATQNALVPYKYTIIAIAPAFPFFLGLNSGYRELGCWCKATHAFYSLTYCIVLFPGANALAMYLGARFSNVFHNFKVCFSLTVGSFVALLGVILNHCAYLLPTSVACGAFDRITFTPQDFDMKEYYGFAALVVACVPFYFAAWWLFKTRGANSNLNEEMGLLKEDFASFSDSPAVGA